MIILFYLVLGFIFQFAVNIIFGNHYSSAFIIFLILGWVYVFSGIYRIFTNVISFHNKTLLISLGAFIQAGVNFFSNVIFIPYFGMYAAALSTSLSMALYAVLLSYLALQLEPIKIDRMKIFYPFLLGFSGTMLLIIQYLNQQFQFLNVMLFFGFYYCLKNSNTRPKRAIVNLGTTLLAKK